MPRTKLERGAKNKIKPSIMEGFASYIAAFRLFDNMVRLSGMENVDRSVMVHPRQPGWVGESKVRRCFCALCRHSQLCSS